MRGALKKTVLVLWMPVLAMLSGCEAGGGGGGGGGGPTEPPTPVPTTISVSPPSVTLTELGSTQQFTATVRDQSGASMTGQMVSWSSADGSIASVTSSGLATATGKGSTSVTATLSSIIGGASLQVRQEATSLSVGPTALSFSATGDTVRLTVTAVDAGGSPIEQPDVVWTSSDDSVVSVVDGLVTSVANGTAMITATSGSASGEAEAMVLLLAELPIVIVVGEKGISTEAAADTVAVGGTTQMSASVTDEEGNPLSVTVRWASSNPAIATVDETGLVTGVYAGTTEIVATYAGVSGARTITVTQN